MGSNEEFVEMLELIKCCGICFIIDCMYFFKEAVGVFNRM